MRGSLKRGIRGIRLWGHAVGRSDRNERLFLEDAFYKFFSFIILRERLKFFCLFWSAAFKNPLLQNALRHHSRKITLGSRKYWYVHASASVVDGDLMRWHNKIWSQLMSLRSCCMH